MNPDSKRAAMQQKHKKWLSDREISLLKDDVSEQVFKRTEEKEVNSKNNHNTLGHTEMKIKQQQSSVENTDLFLNKLTEKLAAHIRYRWNILFHIDSCQRLTHGLI